MKIANSVKINVFVKEGEDEAKIRSKFLEFFPFDLEEKKIMVEEKSATGFNENIKTELPTYDSQGNNIGDLNKDGYLDVVFANWQGNNIIYWGSSSGYSISSRTSLPSQGSTAVSIADMNKDNYLDLIFSNTGTSSNITVYYNSASGFNSSNKLILARKSQTHAIGDLDECKIIFMEILFMF